MNLLCNRNVKDKHTGQDYRAGSVYAFEGDRAREVLTSIYFIAALEPDAASERATDIGQAEADEPTSERAREEPGRGKRKAVSAR